MFMVIFIHSKKADQKDDCWNRKAALLPLFLGADWSLRHGVGYSGRRRVIHTTQVLSHKIVAGRLLKYSAESMAGCDPTIPALGFALSFFGSLPALSVLFGGFEHETKIKSGKGMEPARYIWTG